MEFIDLFDKESAMEKNTFSLDLTTFGKIGKKEIKNVVSNVICKFSENEDGTLGTRTGYDGRLSCIDIKLYTTFHFLLPKTGGSLSWPVCIKDLSSFINCSSQSIKKSIKRLYEHGFIHYEKIRRGYYNITLRHYDSYFDTKENNGSGYIYITNETLKELIKIENVIDLRIALITLERFDSNRLNSSSSKNVVPYNNLKNHKDGIRKYLPFYCKKGIIDKALNRLNNFGESIFKFDYNNSVLSYKFSLNKKFDGFSKRNDYLNKSKNEFRNFLKNINDSVYAYAKNHSLYNENPELRVHIEELGIDIKEIKNNYPYFQTIPIFFNDSILRNLSICSISTSFNLIKQIIIKIFNDRVIPSIAQGAATVTDISLEVKSMIKNQGYIFDPDVTL